MNPAPTESELTRENVSLIEIVEYRPEHHEAFLRLNRTWLEEHDLLEPADLAMLEDPEGEILADGGQIFIALRGGQVVGSCAAIRLSTETIELAKLAVDPTARGSGLGRRLCSAVVAFSRRAGAKEIELSSNHALVPAIRLYESMGFVHEPAPEDPRYASADVYMRLRLQPSQRSDTVD